MAPADPTDQVVLISGAAGGIGAATAERLVAGGARVVLADLDGAAAADLAARLGDRARGVPLDVTDPASCAAAVQHALAEFGRLDVVWANAGISAFGPLELLEPEAWRQVVAVNLVGAYNVVQAALPAVLATRGYVAVTASWASFAHSPGHSAYAAAKAGLEAMANSLRSELAHQGVGVGVFHPGWIATPMVTDKIDHQPAFTALLASLPGPLRTVTPVADVAEVLADAIRGRRSKVVHPRTGWLLHALRPVLATRLVSRGGVRVAPEIRRRFAAAQRPGAASAGSSG